MLHRMLYAIREAYRDWYHAKAVTRELPIPQAVGRYSRDKMGQPGKRRAARWCRT